MQNSRHLEILQRPVEHGGRVHIGADPVVCKRLRAEQHADILHLSAFRDSGEGIAALVAVVVFHTDAAPVVITALAVDERVCGIHVPLAGHIRRRGAVIGRVGNLHKRFVLGKSRDDFHSVARRGIALAVVHAVRIGKQGVRRAEAGRVVVHLLYKSVDVAAHGRSQDIGRLVRALYEHSVEQVLYGYGFAHLILHGAQRGNPRLVRLGHRRHICRRELFGGDHGRHHLGEKGDGHTLVRLLFKQHGVRAGMVKRRGARRNLRLVGRGRGRGQGREQQGGYENKAYRTPKQSHIHPPETGCRIDETHKI